MSHCRRHSKKEFIIVKSMMPTSRADAKITLLILSIIIYAATSFFERGASLLISSLPRARITTGRAQASFHFLFATLRFAADY